MSDTGFKVKDASGTLVDLSALYEPRSVGNTRNTNFELKSCKDYVKQY